MTAKNNIPAGYKDSVVGIIPQEWKVDRLGEICLTFKSGTTITSQSIKESGLYPVYGGNGLRGYTDSYTHNGDYILIGRQGALCGNINFIRGKAYISEHAIAVQPNESNSIEFLRYKLDFWNINRFSESSAQPGLSVEKLVRYKLAVPPIEEQRKIAEILGVWDEAIEKQSRLIEKLELRKRALMQRLLTGRTRLPGFTTPWQKVKLGEIGTFLSTNTLSRDKLNDNNGSIQNIHYGDILVKYSSIVDAKLTAIPYVNEDVAISSDYLENGDIVFSDTAEDNIVGKAVEISNIADKKIVAGLHTMLFRPNKGSYAQHFLGYYLNSDAYRKQLAPLIQGIKVCSISKRAICHTIVLTPSLPEQKAIAEVLTTADDEIATNRKKLDALRLQKRGLMQQLLTGKTRVKI